MSEKTYRIGKLGVLQSCDTCVTGGRGNLGDVWEIVLWWPWNWVLMLLVAPYAYANVAWRAYRKRKNGLMGWSKKELVAKIERADAQLEQMERMKETAENFRTMWKDVSKERERADKAGAELAEAEARLDKFIDILPVPVVAECLDIDPFTARDASEFVELARAAIDKARGDG